MDNPLDSLIGRRIGNYIVHSLLQEGGMGAVYLAEHPEIGRRVAIKVLPRKQSESPGIADRFIVEARAIARIDHPNVIDIYDFGRTADGQLYYSMELLKGRELGELMSERGPMTPAEISPLLGQICTGLQAAHDTGVIHRDLKPENIFLDERGERTVKILDFGIAKLLEQQGGQGLGITQAGMVMGTPYTIAPEQAAGRPDQIGPHTDVYSLGAILYWMLAGYPPFMAEPTAVILAQHIKDSPAPLSEVDPTIPSAVVAVVEHCLSKLPSERPASAIHVARSFTAALRASEAPSAAAPESAPPQPEAPTEDMAPETIVDAVPPPALHAAAVAARKRAAEPATEAEGSLETEPLDELPIGRWRWAVVASVVLAVVLGTLLALSGQDDLADGADERTRDSFAAEVPTDRAVNAERPQPLQAVAKGRGVAVVPAEKTAAPAEIADAAPPAADAALAPAIAGSEATDAGSTATDTPAATAPEGVGRTERKQQTRKRRRRVPRPKPESSERDQQNHLGSGTMAF